MTYRVVKRFGDVVLALILLAFLLIPALFIAIAVKGTSPGPVLFLQQRVGRGGQLFYVAKFRTMVVGAEETGTVTTSTDSRVTPVGRVLRRYKLDEIPQLGNILVGHMSFVGPRPDVPGYADELEGDDRELLLLRPGLTGPATIYYRYEEEILAGQKEAKGCNDRVIYPEKVRRNRLYQRDLGFALDVKCLLATLIPSLATRLGFDVLVPNEDLGTE